MHRGVAAVRNRLASPLFNTQAFTRDIERAYATIYERHQQGLPPGTRTLRNRNMHCSLPTIPVAALMMARPRVMTPTQTPDRRMEILLSVK